MKELWRKWDSISLIKRILVFLVFGAVLGIIFPNMDGSSPIGWIGTLGDLFVSALRSVAPVLVFFLVLSSLANAKGDGSMKTIVILYVIATFLAAVVAVIGSFLFPIEITLADAVTEQSSPEGIAEVLSSLILSIVANPVDALMNANYLGILAWAVLLGIALRMATDTTKGVFASISDAVNTVVRWIIGLAPFGVFGLVYTAVSENGIEIFTEYGALLALLVGCMAIVALGTNAIISYVCIRKNPYPLIFRTLRESGLTAFFTRSSAANIPVNMELCRKLKLNKDTYSVSIPLGATINMGGAAVTITVMTMAACNTLGITVDIPTAIVLSVLAAAGACGASGVAGGSLLLIPLACSLFGIGNDIAMQIVGVGFIIGVIQDSCETAINSSTDVLFTASAEYRTWRKQGKPVDFKEWEK